MCGFLWTGKIFSGTENKDEGQRKEAVGKEQWCEQVIGCRNSCSGTMMAQDRNTASIEIYKQAPTYHH